jgi:hypothetical protein
MAVAVCKHTPTLRQKALYWAHVVWNHNVEKFEDTDRLLRICLMVDWMDGLLDRCPTCLWETLGDDTVHLHHVGDCCCEDDD